MILLKILAQSLGLAEVFLFIGYSTTGLANKLGFVDQWLDFLNVEVARATGNRTHLVFSTAMFAHLNLLLR